MRRATAQDLEFVIKAKKSRLRDLRAGESLVSRTGYTVLELVEKGAIDRLQFSVLFVKDAKSALAMTPPAYRMAVSRAYYAMYHAARSVAFCAHQGDDHQDHSKIPGALPEDFPDRAAWENTVKNARLERNRADYEPYPKNTKSFQSSAMSVVTDSQELISVVRSYLRTKGWKL